MALVEQVDTFCYLGDMLSVHGDCDADAAVQARVHKGWNKFIQLVLLLTNKDVSLLMRGNYTEVVLHGSEIWPVKKE